ncbi:hypothetical protein [Methylobacterium nodulans]|uniref:Uncharacterized protein n=1 Tax=Methylobacterium nodulans (strain LMG 21967 / CNCM I-2342 / ORS 2060) TaxID=460265 RepID=B8IAI1_METNO|nr:hypothetical protein [Methylobacterium nodulans]ACL61026.1 hypothetical protein Mnod_6219 [Methylobacterium nodulans ORS 2060]
MILGPDLTVLKEAAKRKVADFFVQQVQQADPVDPQLRAMYVLKYQEARGVLNGIPSALIEGEASIRGITPAEMAQIIVGMAEQSSQAELSRMATNVAIDAATSEAGVLAVLARFGLTLSLGAAAA